MGIENKNNPNLLEVLRLNAAYDLLANDKVSYKLLFSAKTGNLASTAEGKNIFTQIKITEAELRKIIGLIKEALGVQIPVSRGWHYDDGTESTTVPGDNSKLLDSAPFADDHDVSAFTKTIKLDNEIKFIISKTAKRGNEPIYSMAFDSNGARILEENLVSSVEQMEEVLKSKKAGMVPYRPKKDPGKLFRKGNR